MENYFVIARQMPDATIAFWDNDHKQWSSEASTYDQRIFGDSLPIGANGILELTPGGNPVRFTTTLPIGGTDAI